jgi:hypothetical protein
MSSIRNWKNFHRPFEPMDTFLRSEPTGGEIKATYIDGVSPKRKKHTMRAKAKEAFEALTRPTRKET